MSNARARSLSTTPLVRVMCAHPSAPPNCVANAAHHHTNPDPHMAARKATLAPTRSVGSPCWGQARGGSMPPAASQLSRGHSAPTRPPSRMAAGPLLGRSRQRRLPLVRGKFGRGRGEHQANRIVGRSAALPTLWTDAAGLDRVKQTGPTASDPRHHEPQTVTVCRKTEVRSTVCPTH